jgi:transposase
MAATARALAETEALHRQRLEAFSLAVERARFEAERARRQFDACEPENRLVARSLERAWEERLVVCRQAEADLAAQAVRRPPKLSDEEAAWLVRAGADLHGVFDAATTTVRERKLLLRALITDVVVTVDRPAALARGRICWEGGATTDISLALPRRGDNAPITDEEAVEAVRRLAVHYDDATIARHLGRRGHVTATGRAFTKERVASLRRSRGIPGPEPLTQAATVVTPGSDDVQIVPLTQAQAILGVSRSTLHRWIADGFVAADQDTPGGPRRVRIDTALRAKVVPELPEGWMGLAQAAKVLGVARQTVLDRIRRGELEAVAVTRGRRAGLAIQGPPPQDELFARSP